MGLEEMKYFKKIDDISTYVRKALLAGKLSVFEAKKVANITAAQGEIGEGVETKMKNGLVETTNVVTADPETNQPGWIITNPDGERYIVKDSEFRKKYIPDPEKPGEYKPVSPPVLVTRINENLEFMAAWGKQEKLEAGGILVLANSSKIYGIQPEPFKNTYAETERDHEDCLQAVLDMFGISMEELKSVQTIIQERKSATTSKENRNINTDIDI